MNVRWLLQVSLLGFGLALNGAAVLYRVSGIDSTQAAAGERHTGVTCPHCRDAGASGSADVIERQSLKIDPGMASCGTCQAPSGCFRSDAADEPECGGLTAPLTGGPSFKDTAEKGRVAAMVEQALNDQARLLRLRQAQLRRWDPRTRAHFVTWFGTTDNRARSLIFKRMSILLKINDAYAVANFRRAVPSRPGVFAFVRPTDPTKVFLDRQFVLAPPLGTNSRAGTLTHEMSHFAIAGATKDHTYGTENCRALARTNPVLALTNADNFEFFIEGSK